MDFYYLNLQSLNTFVSFVLFLSNYRMFNQINFKILNMKIISVDFQCIIFKVTKKKNYTDKNRTNMYVEFGR